MRKNVSFYHLILNRKWRLSIKKNLLEINKTMALLSGVTIFTSPTNAIKTITAIVIFHSVTIWRIIHTPITRQAILLFQEQQTDITLKWLITKSTELLSDYHEIIIQIFITFIYNLIRYDALNQILHQYHQLASSRNHGGVPRSRPLQTKQIPDNWCWGDTFSVCSNPDFIFYSI